MQEPRKKNLLTFYSKYSLEESIGIGPYTVLAVNNVVWYKSLCYVLWDNCTVQFKVRMCGGEC